MVLRILLPDDAEVDDNMNNALFCASTKSRVVLGDFVLCSVPDEPDSMILCQILNVSSDDVGGNKALLCIWPYVSSSSVVEILSNMQEYNVRGIREVMEGREGFTTDGSHIANIAFLFHIDDIESNRYGNLNGIKILFFFRYTNITGTPIKITHQSFVPFKDTSEYRHRIFQSV